MKVCSKCGIEKDEGEFYKNKNTKSGLTSWCKLCNCQSQEKNKDCLKQYKKEWYEKNKELRKEIYKKHNKKYYEQNKEHRKEYQKEYNKKWQEHHAEQRKEYTKEWYKKNRIQIGENSYTINACPDELKPVIKQLIDIRNTKKELNEKRKKIEKGEI